MPFQLMGEELVTRQLNYLALRSQFLRGRFLRASEVTVKSRQYRSGQQTLRLVAEELMELGRLQGWVNEERILVVEELAEQPRVMELRVREDGGIERMNGTPVLTGDRVCGKWAGVSGIEAGGGAGPAGGVLIRRAIWTGGQMRAQWRDE